jgi:hypothetical protein
MDHPQLGPIHYIAAEGMWVGSTPEGYEICVLGDLFEDAPDADCETLAVRELSDLSGLLARIEAFLASAREPYLDQWAGRRWEVLSLVFSKQEGRPTFIAEYLLERDDYTVWQVRVKDGLPVALGRR